MARERLVFDTEGRPTAHSALLSERLPGALIGIGENYWAATPGVRAASRIPLVFGKFAGSAIGAGAPVVVDQSLSRFVVCEGELALIVGRRARAVRTEQAALDTLAGVCVANDISARDLQAADGQSTRGKSVDTFCPLGPALVTLDELPDLRSLEITTRIDGRTVQRASTAQLVFSVAELVMFCSEFMTLYPGDVILTGTPVSDDDQLRLRPGMTVEVTISGVGTLRNPVVGAPE